MPFSSSKLYRAGLRGWKFGIMPIKFGKGIIGVSDRGRRISCLGSRLSGGGMRCFETNISCDYYDSWMEG